MKSDAFSDLVSNGYFPVSLEHINSYCSASDNGINPLPRDACLKRQQVFPSYSFRFSFRHGISTWMCTDIDGGDSFREEILANVRDAKVFLIFLNEKWAKSQECTFECNYAMVRYTFSTIVAHLKKFIVMKF